MTTMKLPSLRELHKILIEQVGIPELAEHGACTRHHRCLCTSDTLAKEAVGL
jgi:hypothetical protein